MKPGGHARVVVMDAHGKRAWSNPVWPNETNRRSFFFEKKNQKTLFVK